jgi:hypothetical protein
MAGVFPADAPTHGDARPVNDPTHRALVDSRYWVQAGSVACGLLTALHVIGLFGPADGAMKFGTLIGGVICAVIARKLWILNSVPAAVGALIMLSLEATGIVIAAVVVTQQAPSDRLFGCVAVCSISALMVFLGYQTLRSARRIRRFAIGS